MVVKLPHGLVLLLLVSECSDLTIDRQTKLTSHSLYMMSHAQKAQPILLQVLDHER